MSIFLDKVKNGFNNFVNSLEVIAANMLILICLIALLIACLYLYVTYSIANKKIDDLTQYAISESDA
jgi:archaellum component FlaF (FlaF/FlaG flagellin family)